MGLARYAILLAGGLSCGAPAMNHEPSEKAAVNVLFLGNSYTDQIQETFKQVVATTAHADSSFAFVWGGGATLQKLIDNGRALKAIRRQRWDYVVLQEQSVRPALGGQEEAAFHASVDLLAAEIRKAGAEPILYMTWGRRDGLKIKDGQVLDFETMTKRLSEAYRKAAKRNKLRIAPVGEAWALVRKKDPALGRELYTNDGSHPSEKGALVASCVFLRVLFDEPLEKLAAPPGMDAEDVKLIKETVAGMVKDK